MCVWSLLTLLVTAQVALSAVPVPDSTDISVLSHAEPVIDRVHAASWQQYKFRCHDSDLTDVVSTALFVNVSVDSSHPGMEHGVPVFISTTAVATPRGSDWKLRLKGEPHYIHKSDVDKWPEDGTFYISVGGYSLGVFPNRFRNKDAATLNIDDGTMDYEVVTACLVKQLDTNEQESDGDSHVKVEIEHGDIVASWDQVGTPSYHDLTNGQMYRVTQGGAVYPALFHFHLPIGDFQLQANPIYGDPDIYVTTSATQTPGPDHYEWKSTNFGREVVLVRVNDPGYCSNCTYYIGIYPFNHTRTQYLLLASWSTHTIHMVNGAPIRVELVQPWRNLFFDFIATSTGVLSVSAQALSGDPDLFISTRTQRPGPTNNQWHAMLYGSDVIDLMASGGISYFIDLMAADERNSTCVLTASLGVPSQLMQGVAQTGVVPRGRFQYFTLEVRSNSSTGTVNISVSLTVTNGSAWFSVGRNALPGRSNETWHSPNLFPEQFVSIPQTAADCPNNNLCTYYIGVFGENSTNRFEVVAEISAGTNNPNHVVLTPGVPVQAAVPAGGYTYFSWDCDNAETDVSITVTPYYGDPDLYVTVPPNAFPFPNATVSNYSSSAFGGESLSLPGSSLVLGTYFIGVYGFSATNFSISVNEMSRELQLLDGVPQTASVPKGMYNYYTYTHDQAESRLALSLDAFEGSQSAVLLLSYYFRPSLQNYDFMSFDDIVLPHAAAFTYHIAVYAYNSTDYEIEAESGNSQEELLEGVPLFANISQGDSMFYTSYVGVWNMSHPFRIMVTPKNDAFEASLYVSVDNEFPTSTDHTWEGSLDGNGGLVLNVMPTDSAACDSCNYYIAVVAKSDICAYEIATSFPPDEDVQLQDGDKQDGDIPANSAEFYRYNIPAGAHSVKIFVQVSSGSPSLYVSNQNQQPNQQNAIWTGTAAQGYVSLLIKSSDSHWCGDCPLFIAVSAGSKATVYTIQAAHA